MAMGDPQNGGFLLGKILLERMMTGGTPISGNLHMTKSDDWFRAKIYHVFPLVPDSG